jgi:hypothetical protein
MKMNSRQFMKTLPRLGLMAALALPVGARAELLPGEESEFLIGGLPVEEMLSRRHDDGVQQTIDRFTEARLKFPSAASCLIESNGEERLHWEAIEGLIEPSVCLFRVFSALDGTPRLATILMNSGLVLESVSLPAFSVVSGERLTEAEAFLSRGENYKLFPDFLDGMPIQNIVGWLGSFFTQSVIISVNRDEQGRISGSGTSYNSIWLGVHD